MKAALPFAFAVLLAACSSEAPEPEPTPTATVAAPRTLVAANLDREGLGAKIEGPDGTDPQSPITVDGKQVGMITSFVACPKDMTTCDPATLPAGTKLTYVYTIMPDPTAGEDLRAVAPQATNPAGTTEMPPAYFRTTRPAPGFGGTLGYAKDEAAMALGDEDAITVTVDEGQIIWRVTGGEGWKAGKPVTVWWQSTEPPQGPQQAFEIEWNGMTAPVTAPFPASEKPVERAPKR